MAWKLDSSQPIYLQLQTELELRIVTGVYPPGSQMPAVRVLAQEAAVNPNTMQRALQELEQSGLLHAQRTAGRFITENLTLIEQSRQHLAAEQATIFFERMQKLGYSRDDALRFAATLQEEPI